MNGRLAARRVMILQLLGAAAPSCGGDAESEIGRGGQAPALTPSTSDTPSTPNTPASMPTASLTPCGTSTPITERPGYELCDSGLVHRAEVVSCVNTIADYPEPAAAALPIMVGAEGLACSSHSDCVERANGYCRAFGIPLTVGFQCAYGCLDDDECNAGAVCHCQAPAGACSSADCATDAECGAGLLCVEVRDHSGCGIPPTYACQTAADECAVSADCPEARVCVPSNGRFACAPLGAACGRPFLIAGEARMASLVDGSGWSLAPAVECAGITVAGLTVAGLTVAEREVLASHWASVGLMEHASVAAFARFTLQLLQVGAPADLVAASICAQADETQHAMLAFGLAGAYAGASVGPGVLALDDVDIALPLCQILRIVLREGCVGETLAALEASQALDACREPVVRAALERITHDESNHSDLAWRFVRWAIGVDPALLSEVEAECARLRAQRAAQPATGTAATKASPSDGRLAAHGFVSERERALLHRSAAVEVLLPCLEALVSMPQAA